MKILLTSATSAEIAPLTEYIKEHWESPGGDMYTNGVHELHILVAGVGMVATSYALTKALRGATYEFALQAGICGSFDTKIVPGELVFITSEMFGDLGAEDRYQFLDIFDLGLEDPNCFPFSNQRLITPVTAAHHSIRLPLVSGLTVNTISGSSFTTEARLKKFNCQVESMEGAAFHYICLQEHIPFAQVRAVSNQVEMRDKSKWKIPEAVRTLNEWLIGYLDHSEKE